MAGRQSGIPEFWCPPTRWKDLTCIEENGLEVKGVTGIEYYVQTTTIHLSSTHLLPTMKCTLPFAFHVHLNTHLQGENLVASAIKSANVDEALVIASAHTTDTSNCQEELTVWSTESAQQ